jgi:hypothetical protein
LIDTRNDYLRSLFISEREIFLYELFLLSDYDDFSSFQKDKQQEIGQDSIIDF